MVVATEVRATSGHIMSEHTHPCATRAECHQLNSQQEIAISDSTFATAYPRAPGLFILNVLSDSMLVSNGDAGFSDQCSIVIDSNLNAVDGDFLVVRRPSDPRRFQAIGYS
jgi:SOS-response transcriptional repressor LexA